LGAKLAQVQFVDVQVNGHLAHAVDDVIEVVRELHGVENVETHDERVVQELVDIVDDGICLVLEVNYAIEVPATAFDEMPGALDDGLGQVFEKLRKTVVVRGAEQIGQGTLFALHGLSLARASAGPL